MAFLTPDSQYNANNVTVNEYMLTKHNPNKISMPTSSMTPIGVTVHNTGWISTATGTTPAEQYTRATVNGHMNSVRVHYYVDNVCVWQCLPLNRSGWHAADGNGNGNRKTIAIECIMDTSSDTDTKSVQSEDNCARLVAYLLHKYNWTIDKNLFTHTYWLHVRDGHSGSKDELCTRKHSYKTCPQYIIPHWSDFKLKVQKYLDELKGSGSSSTETTFENYLVKITSEDGFVNVRKTPSWEETDIVATIQNCNTKYTIVDEITFDGVKFGKLKSGIGWVALSCCTKC